MPDFSSKSGISIGRLILIPAVITLCVTLLRLTGELEHWSSVLFNRSAGGGGAIIGITWLPIIFGPYFAAKLAGSGHRPASSGKAIGYAVLGVIIFVGGLFLGFAPVISFPGRIAVGLALIALAAALQFVPWRKLGTTLIAYGYAARIPVAIIMYFAIQGAWGTHYDALPPEGAPAAFWPKYIQIALVPQLVMWIAYTIVVGALFGSLYIALARRKSALGRGEQPVGA